MNKTLALSHCSRQRASRSARDRRPTWRKIRSFRHRRSPRTKSRLGPAQDPADLILAPKTYKETTAEVPECMKTWDPQTEHEQAKSTSAPRCASWPKYFPEKAR